MKIISERKLGVRPSGLFREIFVGEAMNYLREHLDCSIELVEFCVHDDLTAGCFKREFEKRQSLKRYTG
jgi:hypothetical protein